MRKWPLLHYVWSTSIIKQWPVLTVQYVLPAVIEHQQISHQVSQVVHVPKPRGVLKYNASHDVLVLSYVYQASKLQVYWYGGGIVAEIRFMNTS